MTPAPPPVIETARLLLRPFALDDAEDVRRLAGAREIADTTLTVPHPYEPGVAEAWIGTHARDWDLGHQVVFAIVDASRTLVGAIGLTAELAHRHAELGYWIGKPYWNRGYATEASRAVIDFGFRTMDLHRIHARHLVRNAASGRVLIKAGLRHEGTLREHLVKWGKAEDVAAYGILRSDRLRAMPYTDPMSLVIDRTEAAEYYFKYIDRVVLAPGQSIADLIATQLDDAAAFFGGITETQSSHRYAPDKWSLRQVLSHINDTERVFAYRALWFARGFPAELPGFDQDVAIATAGADARSWSSHVEEFRAIRAASVTLFRNLPPDAWMRRGIASGNPFSVRALAFITAGHVAHHMAIVRERYL